VSPFQQLTLFWLLARPTGKGSLAELHGGLQPLLKHIGGWKAGVKGALAALDHAELVGLTRDSLRLKPGGKEQALKLLGLTSPPETTWAGLKIGILAPNLLQLPRPENLRMTADDLSAAVIRRWLDEPDELAPRAGRSSPQAARRQEPVPSRASAATLAEDPAAFAQRVLAAARATPKAGWFGDNKVFISHVYRQLGDPGQNLEAFKERLVRAHRAGLLSLSRADLVEAMDPKDVEESDTHYRSATWNFITLPDEGRW
jgi:hypothetical protein